MTLVTTPEITVPGSITGNGATIVIDNVADNSLATFAFAPANKAAPSVKFFNASPPITNASPTATTP